MYIVQFTYILNVILKITLWSQIKNQKHSSSSSSSSKVIIKNKIIDFLKKNFWTVSSNYIVIKFSSLNKSC